MREKRIQEMETAFQQQEALMRQVESLLDQLETSQLIFQELLAYYQSPQFLSDMEWADRQESLPFPCGILSQDGFYNFLLERQEVGKSLAEIGKEWSR
ncbi:DUF4298 domain-containing protein [Streptococcus suis]|uniref:DUF4298 domain-containing protein n=1 Tax=Streptococcus suis TaxID=1307 RepID=A0A4T2GPS1_STRSU|nr:DUF4298 domain-containing protein [Streptococcus suis]MBM7268984.1 DUF4298 domain-containing protein [Streptococcus suis]MBM7269302.1 DUF4298 domain-containing protein [Streptococcus suis]TII00082.1 DUF4298 domain-containing protein [Streptococcus suis]TII01023.1 DUF4298 domain-containing protein [Streptococcus suis]